VVNPHGVALPLNLPLELLEACEQIMKCAPQTDSTLPVAGGTMLSSPTAAAPLEAAGAQHTLPMAVHAQGASAPASIQKGDVDLRHLFVAMGA
jgi:hypothetical protein